ncbi:MAG: hypothetical protein ACTHW2_12850 [Tissierella sp.]|uniref:hypothetical protein n=1 Tax=Tissierella sp. TaxID=41274 RepID=UPI003F962522
MEQKYDNYYKNMLQGFCRVNNIYLGLTFEEIEGLVAIDIKNNLENGVNLDCLRIIDFIYRTVTPFDIKYTQTLHLYPNSKRLDKVTVLFDKNDYMLLNKILGDKISN